MITQVCQRWRDRRGRYRPAGEPICTRRYEVAVIGDDRTPRAFVERHHYSGSYVAARFRVGLYRGAELVGVAVFSQPTSQAALHAVFPWQDVVACELGRFVLLDDVEANGESWFLARSFELASAAGFQALVAHSDPQPRFQRSGETVFPGHVGTIYQATNARYTGRTPARTWRMFDDGTVFSARAWSKLRGRERGYRYVVQMLEQHGASTPKGDWDRWVRSTVEQVTTPIRHRGTHRYVWMLDSRLRKRLPKGRAYPKLAFEHALSFAF